MISNFIVHEVHCTSMCLHCSQKRSLKLFIILALETVLVFLKTHCWCSLVEILNFMAETANLNFLYLSDNNYWYQPKNWLKKNYTGFFWSFIVFALSHLLKSPLNVY